MTGLCDCGKRPFFTEADAKMAVADAIQAREQGWAPWRRERRAYRCPNDRNTWHLTSRETHPDQNGTLLKNGVGNIKPADIVARVEELYPETRVECKNGQWKIYPPDRSQSPIFFATRFNDGTARSNCIAQLRRAGLDIMTEPPKESPMTNGRAPLTHPLIQDPPRPGPPTAAETSNKAITALVDQVGELSKQQEVLLGMLAEAEKRATGHEKRLTTLERPAENLTGLVDADNSELVKRIVELERRDQVRLKSLAAVTAQAGKHTQRIKALEDALNQAGSAEPVEQVDPTAELDRKILEFMAATPLVKWSAAVLAANLDGEPTGNAVGKRLSVLANDGKVTTVERAGVAKVYQLAKTEPADA